MKKIYDRFERKALIGNKNLQWLFESLHRFSLRGMNYDQVQSIKTSGELFVLEHVNKKLDGQNKIILFDVGANVGEYSKILSRYFPSATVYAFEALPSTYQQLKQNTSNLKNMIAINKALGSVAEERLFYSDGEGSHLSSFYPVESGGVSPQLNKTSLSVGTIDSFCEENQIDKIDFLKIDVEGYELEVLKGAEKMLRNGKIHTIQFEFGENYVLSQTHFYDLYTLLNQYRVSRILKNGLRMYENYSKQWEIYLSANYLAELK